MHIYADQISKVALSNGNLRIQLTQRGPENETIEAGTLILPASQANNFVNSLAGSLKELGERIKAQQEETQ
ncbi:MAG: hypothetical protein R6U22_09490 [Desulfohalobiaceae bacterium]